MCRGPQIKFLGPLPFSLLLWDWPSYHSFLHCDGGTTRASLRGLGGRQSPRPPVAC